MRKETRCDGYVEDQLNVVAENLANISSIKHPLATR